MSSSVAAIIPVLNEAGAIGPTIAQLPRDVVGTVIVVDGGSTDGTREEAESAGAVVLLEKRRGYGRACLTGAEHARDLGADILIFLDGDGADAGELAGSLIDPIVAGEADFVLADRTGQEREAGSMGAHQVLAGTLIGGAVGVMTGVRYRDMCAFRALRTRDLMALGMQEMTYGWNLEMQIRAARRRLRIREIQLPYRCRIAGQSKVAGNWRGTLRAGYRIIGTLVRLGLVAR